MSDEVATMTKHDVQMGIYRECNALARMLVAKNKAYGNSVLEPLRVFSRADPAEQLRVRIDDKLSRLARGEELGEDTVLDLLGYLVLLRVALKAQAASSEGNPDAEESAAG